MIQAVWSAKHMAVKPKVPTNPRQTTVLAIISVTPEKTALPENTDSELPEKLTDVFEKMRKDGTEEKILKKYLPETSGYLEVDKIENN